MVRSVSVVHMRYNIQIPGNLQFPAILWSMRCQISEILLYYV